MRYLLLLALATAIGVSACQKKTVDNPPSPEVIQPTTPPAATPPATTPPDSTTKPADTPPTQQPAPDQQHR